MLAAKTELKNAEKVKNILVSKNLLNADFGVVKEFDYIFFPILKRSKIPHSTVLDAGFSFPERFRNQTIHELLSNKLTKKELSILPHSQEIVGRIMILEVPEELRAKEKTIAEAYLKINKNIETVVRKDQFHSGEYRLRTVKILAGKKSKETMHTENGIRMKLHLENTYFSARSANERLRIAQQVKNGEDVLVMFSGAAPYPLVLGKNSPAKKITGIEINPLAHRYAVDNITLNKMQDKVAVFLGDVRTMLPKMKKKFDRIAMPLPKTSEEFLPLALSKVKPNGIIHYYSFVWEPEAAKETRKVKEICKKAGKIVKILRQVRCGQFAPGTFRVCYDLKVK